MPRNRIRLWTKLLAFALFVACSQASSAWAEPSSGTKPTLSARPSPQAKQPASGKPTLFLSCPQECFDTYLRQELSYFDFTRDPHLADLTLVIVRQPAGNGGERFTVTIATLTARMASTAEPVQQAIMTRPGAPAHDTRQQLLQAILRALLITFKNTPHETAFELGLPPRNGAALSVLPDPWNYWVIAPELKGMGEGGSGYYFAELTGALTVRRITEQAKVRLRSAYQQSLSSYRLEDSSRVHGHVYSWEGKALYAHSIGEHWALGAVATGSGSEFENLHGHTHGGPLAEYNIFPYAENASRQLRLAYQLGAWANWYFERNAKGQLHEVRPYHALSLIADVNQPWGSVQWVGQANMFLNDYTLYRLSTGVVLTVRLLEGLAVSLEGEAALVRDLINLRGRQVTDLELLLWTAQQPTDYTFEFALALTYTFGSTHNTIVNPRFGRVDLDEE